MPGRSCSRCWTSTTPSWVRDARISARWLARDGWVCWATTIGAANEASIGTQELAEGVEAAGGRADDDEPTLRAGGLLGHGSSYAKVQRSRAIPPDVRRSPACDSIAVNEPRAAVPLVVIGGSAGAIRPLARILGALPPTLDAAVAVVIHVPDDSPSALARHPGAGSARCR